MITREQRYAASAYTRVQAFGDATPDANARKQYKSMAQELPILIRRAGLLQALAFIKRSSAEADRKLADDVAHTALGLTLAQLEDLSQQAQLLQYMRLTEQVMAALVWYKRAAQIVLSDEALAQRTAAAPVTAEGA
jgi:CRISPR-associated protein Cmr5